MSFPPAAQPDIVRAAQRDGSFVARLRGDLQDLVGQLFGNRWVQRYDTSIDLAASVLYYGLTTVVGLQTLGEEYCDIRQMDGGSMRPPSLLRRLALVSVALGIPYVVHEAIQTLSAGLPASEDNNTTVDEVNDGDDDEGERRRRRQQLQRQKLLRDRLRVARQGVLQWAVPINLVFFYFFGSFYNLAKRVTGVRYVFGRQLREGESKPGYHVLGVLLLIQLAFQLAQTISTRIQERQKLVKGGREPDDAVASSPAVDHGESEQDEPSDNSPTCMLCLTPSTSPTAAPCGHLFCWDCICKWTQEKPECPFCRRAVALNLLVPLSHFALSERQTD